MRLDQVIITFLFTKLVYTPIEVVRGGTNDVELLKSTLAQTTLVLITSASVTICYNKWFSVRTVSFTEVTYLSKPVKLSVLTRLSSDILRQTLTDTTLVLVLAGISILASLNPEGKIGRYVSVAEVGFILMPDSHVVTQA